MKQSDDAVSDRLATGEAGSQEEEGPESLEVADVVAATIAMLAEAAIVAWALGLFGDEDLLYYG